MKGSFVRALAALSAALAPLGCDCSEPVVPEPSCLSTAPRDFRPDQATVQHWSEGNGDFEGFSDAMRLNQCNTRFGQVEGTHCGPKLDAFCARYCTSPSDNQACMQTQREAVMQECREQTFRDFARALPNCCPVKLEGSALVATTDACPPP